MGENENFESRITRIVSNWTILVGFYQGNNEYFGHFTWLSWKIYKIYKSWKIGKSEISEIPTWQLWFSNYRRQFDQLWPTLTNKYETPHTPISRRPWSQDHNLEWNISNHPCHPYVSRVHLNCILINFLITTLTTTPLFTRTLDKMNTLGDYELKTDEKVVFVLKLQRDDGNSGKTLE